MKFDGKVFTHSTLEEGYDFFITDKWKKKHHFKISTFPSSGGILSEAIEVVTSSKSEPYEFSILSSFDSDVEYADLQLKAKIKEGINKKYLGEYDGSMVIGDDNELAGRIDWNDDPQSPEYSMVLVIDGKRITMEEFWKMLNSYEGFQFKFKIIDRTEE